MKSFVALDITIYPLSPLFFYRFKRIFCLYERYIVFTFNFLVEFFFAHCYRFVFDSIFHAEIFCSCTTYIHRVCKPNLDIAMLIDGKIVILIEHQSTINQNMPFRFLEYIARIYEKITTKDEKFGRKLVKLPVPEFYVFYNGKDDYPTESMMKLSDAFMQLGDNCELKNQLENANYPLEIFVKVININVDKENPILKRCEALKEYSEFIEQVRSNIENDVPEPFTTAIKEAIKKGFLSDYLNRKSTEVQNMLLAEYDYDTDIAVQRKEAFNDGILQGRNEGIAIGEERGISLGITQGAYQKAIETAKNMKSENMSVDMIAHFTGLSVEEIEKL